MRYEISDQTKDRERGLVLGGPSRMKLAAFGFNCSFANSATTAAGHVEVAWDEQIRIAQAAERAGFEAVIPIARWRGTGGPIDFNGRTFETMTWAAGLAAATRTVQVFSTVHVPTVHPVRAAKQLATVDHISGGRLGLNIVAGWNEAELRMFGLEQREHDERYDVAEEWFDLLSRLWTETAPFDFAGRYFDSPGAVADPRPVQKGGPVIMSAGVSPRGQTFASRVADIIFIQPAEDLRRLGENVARMKLNARSAGNDLKCFFPTYVVCADTDKEAWDYWDYYVNEKGSRRDIEMYIGQLVSGDMRSRNFDAWQHMVTEMVAGGGAAPLVGSPETLVRRIGELADVGIDGLTMSWVDFELGIEYFGKNVVPLLVDAGLRTEPA